MQTELKVKAKDDPNYAEVFSMKDIDKNLICQVFLMEGYTLTFDNYTITKDQENG